MATTGDQYLAYLKRRVDALEAGQKLMEEQKVRPVTPTRLLYRVRSNGAGNQVFHNGRWIKANG